MVYTLLRDFVAPHAEVKKAELHMLLDGSGWERVSTNEADRWICSEWLRKLEASDAKEKSPGSGGPGPGSVESEADPDAERYRH